MLKTSTMNADAVTSINPNSPKEQKYTDTRGAIASHPHCVTLPRYGGCDAPPHAYGPVLKLSVPEYGDSMDPALQKSIAHHVVNIN